MAKPGSDAARQINGQGVDLAARALTDEQAAEAQEVIELKNGMRCAGCFRRISVGIVFTSIDVREPERMVVKIATCNREDCDYAELARDGATCMEYVEFAWLDDAGIDARPAVAPTRAREARERREAADG